MAKAFDNLSRDQIADKHRGNTVSREHWRNVAAVWWSKQDWPTLNVVIAEGYREFHHRAKPMYDVQGFKDDDYRYIYGVIEQCVKSRTRVNVKLIMDTDDKSAILGPDGRKARHH